MKTLDLRPKNVNFESAKRMSKTLTKGLNQLICEVLLRQATLLSRGPTIAICCAI